MRAFLVLLLACTSSPKPGTQDPSASDAGTPDGGLTDSGAPSLDEDGDGFLAGPEGDDCDDTDAAVHPDAEEICGDGTDQDCDGVEQGCQGEISNRDAAGWVDSDEEASLSGVGRALVVVEGWRSDGGPLIVAGAPISWAPEDEFADGYRTANGALVGLSPEAITGRKGGSAADVAAFRVDAHEVDIGLGISLGAAEFDGDGVDDLVVGAPGGPFAEDSGGGVWWFPGPIEGDGWHDELSGHWLDGGDDYEQLGWDLAVGGDSTGDGRPDLVARESSGCTPGDVEKAWFVDGAELAAGRTGDAVSFFPLPASCLEARAGDVVLADLDGDGLDDLVVGAMSATTVTSEGPPPAAFDEGKGRVAVFLGPLSEEHSWEDADVDIEETGVNGRFGQGVSAVDSDGDGTADLFLMAGDADVDGVQQGIVWGLSAPLSHGAAYEVEEAASVSIRGGRSEALRGGDVFAGGDHDGDGQPELVLSRYHTDDLEAGQILLFGGPLRGELGPDDAVLTVTASGEGEHFGASAASSSRVFGRHDLDADGFDDLLVHAAGDYGEGAGSLFLFYGGTWDGGG